MPEISIAPLIDPCAQDTVSQSPSLPSKAALRRVLLAQRMTRSTQSQAKSARVLQSKLLSWCLAHSRAGQVMGLFAPHLGEPDVLVLVDALQREQRDTALPCVVAKNAPLKFARWHTGDALQADAYGIATPTLREWVVPDVLVLPCVGFTGEGGRYYRLGYGGGFYDRTVAQLRMANPAFVAVGLAYSASRCMFEPGLYDAALACVLTDLEMDIEAGIEVGV